MYRFTLMRCMLILTVISLALASSVGITSAQDPVPAKYQRLYVSLDTILDEANKRVDATPQAKPAPITFAAELIVADANRGSALLDPATLPATRAYLDGLQKLGITGVKQSIGFPFLLPAMPRYAEYLAFFRTVAKEVKQRNLKLVIQSNMLFANTAFSEVKFDFKTLSFERFRNEYKAMIQTVITELQPDELVLISEPDTAANLTGFAQLKDPKVCLELIQFVLKGLARGTTKIAAGTGSWSPTTFVEYYAKETDLDLISLHIYPVMPQMLTNAAAMVELAHRYNKGVTLDEAWLYKITDITGASNVAASEKVFALDAFSFWSPLDQKFIRLMAHFARATNVEFVSFFWSMYLFSYVDYTPALESSSYANIRQEVNRNAFANVMNGKFSPTGEYLKQVIAEVGKN